MVSRFLLTKLVFDVGLLFSKVVILWQVVSKYDDIYMLMVYHVYIW